MGSILKVKVNGSWSNIVALRGDPGLPNTLSIGTVSEADTAYASITGSSPNQVLNLGLPRGPQGSNKVVYTATIPTTGWTGSGPYTITISVPGILSTDNPVVGLVQDANVQTATAQKEAFASISRVVTQNNNIVIYAYEDLPTVALPIQILCVR